MATKKKVIKKEKKPLKKRKIGQKKREKNTKKVSAVQKSRINLSKKRKSITKKVIRTSKSRKKSSKVSIERREKALIDRIRQNVSEAAKDFDSKYKVTQTKKYVEARLIFDGDPTLMGNIIRDIQTNKKFLPKGKRARFQITFIPDEDLKELMYFKRNRMTTKLVDYKELMGKFRKMVDTTKEREWNFKQMFVGIVVDDKKVNK